MTLTPEASKQARAQLGLSQRKVAAQVGIARVQLSLFELDKAVYSDTPRRLTRFYQERNALPPMPVCTPASSEHQNEAVANESALDTATLPASCFTVTDAVPDEPDVPEPPDEPDRDSSYEPTPGWLTFVATTVLAIIVAVLVKSIGGNPPGVTPIYRGPFDR